MLMIWVASVWCCSANGSLKSLQVIMESGQADLDALTAERQTPLILAAAKVTWAGLCGTAICSYWQGLGIILAVTWGGYIIMYYVHIGYIGI